MGTPELIVIGVYAVIAGLVIYFIWRRIQDKKKEHFEKRDN